MPEYPGNTVPQNADNLELTVKKILAGLDGGTWTGGGAGSSSPAQPKGSPNKNNFQQTSTGTAATLAVARPTRTACYIGNTDATNAVWVGSATVTTSNGVKIPAGGFFIPTWVGLIQIIDDGSNHAVVCVWDEYS